MHLFQVIELFTSSLDVYVAETSKTNFTRIDASFFVFDKGAASKF